MKLYLDVCTICRPYDDQKMMRIRLETDAVHLILSKIFDGTYQAVTSRVHTLEVSAISDFTERIELLTLLSRFRSGIEVDKVQAAKRAEYLHSLGFGLADAAHLAYAEVIADVFVTCDDKLIKKSQKEDIRVPVYNPIEFVMKEDLQ
jgi:predicted nucleic acid-binding protein